MTTLALTGIGTLITCDAAAGAGILGRIDDAVLVCGDDRVLYAGPARGSGVGTGADRAVDVGGRCVLPGFVDSHTHLDFAGDRAAEFADRMAGRPYAPGGILDTVAATRAAPAASLRAQAERLVRAARAGGTTTIEIKTGYGLSPEPARPRAGRRPGLLPRGGVGRPLHPPVGR